MGKKPDRSLLNDIFGTGDTLNVPIMRGSTKRPSAAADKRGRKPKPMTARDRFLKKVADGEFEDFTKKDWLEYFVYKASGVGVRYIPGNYAKEYAILNRLMGELHYADIKRMIDFIFDSDQDFHDTQTAGLFLLSGGWINTIYQNSLLWEEGKYVPRNQKQQKQKAPSRQREWVASRKDAGTGISYGKPIRDEAEDVAEEPTATKGKRKRVKF